MTEARLYGDDPDDGVGGDGAFFLLLDEPEVYGLPPDPVVTTRDLPRDVEARRRWPRWRWRPRRPSAFAVGRRRSDRSATPRRRAGRRGGERRWCRRPSSRPTTAGRSSRPPVVEARHRRRTSSPAGWPPAPRCSRAGADLTGRPGAAPRRPARPRSARSALSTFFLVHDLGRPARFLNMLRVAKPTSPMSMGTWILTAFGAAAGLAAVAEAAPCCRARALGLAPGRCRRRPGGGLAAAASRRRWPRTPRCCSPTRPRRPGTRRYPRAAVRLRRQRAGQRRRRSA